MEKNMDNYMEKMFILFFLDSGFLDVQSEGFQKVSHDCRRSLTHDVSTALFLLFPHNFLTKGRDIQSKLPSQSLQTPEPQTEVRLYISKPTPPPCNP